MSFLHDNYIFTWACGQEFLNSSGFLTFCNSVEQVGFGQLVVFADKFHDDWYESLTMLGHDAKQVNGVYYLLRDRWLHYANELYETKAKYVLLCDSKDVIFQDDPFKIVNDLDLSGEFAILCDEGITHGENGWNGGDQFRCQIHIVGEWKKQFLERKVLNGGFLLGTPKKLASIAMMIWSNMIRNPQPPFSDQAMLNYLYFWLEKDPDIHVCNPIDHNLCLTGQGMIEEKVQCTVKNGCFINQKTKKQYYAFHQWDRTEYAEEIKIKEYQ